MLNLVTAMALLSALVQQWPRVIVVARDAPAPVRAGAELLAHELEASLGRALAVTAESTNDAAMFVGRSDALDRRHPGIEWAALGGEGFVLETRDRDLVVAGGSARASLYAAHALLEHLGRRVLDSRCVVSLPRAVALPSLARRDVPRLEYREAYFTDAFATSFAVANRLNGARHELSANEGGRVSYSHFVHTFYEIVPPATYFDAHPEYFALVDGKRLREGAQLCLTNPQVLQIAIDTVRSWIAAAPDATIFSVSQNDCLNPCACDACQAIDDREGSHAGSMIAFVNQVAAAIAADHPDKAIDTLAYQYTRKPPKALRPLPNVIVRLCSIECCFSHPLATCPKNASFRDDLVGWSKLTDRLYVWDYVTNFAHYLMPLPNISVLVPNIRFFADHGVRGLFEEGNYSPGGRGEMNELKAYVVAQALWNPGVDARHTRDEFVRGYYGSAAEPIARWLDRLDEIARDASAHAFIYDPPAAKYLSDATLGFGEACFADALARADDDAVRERVRVAALAVRYVRLMRAGGDERKALRDAFVNEARAVGVTHVGEVRTLETLVTE